MTTTPAQFRSAHSDVTAWSTFDFEVYERLVEAAKASAAPLPVRPGLSGLSPAGVAALDRLLKAAPYLESDNEFNYVVGYDLDRAAA